MSEFLTCLRHLNWSARLALVGYPLRGLLVRPAPTEERCVMGSPVSSLVWCPRRSVEDTIWCRAHTPHKEGE